MNLVIDTSALLAVVLEEPQKPRLIEATRGMTLGAPPSVHWEVGSALTAAFKRRRLTLEQAHAAVTAYARIPLQWQDVALGPTLTLCHRLGLYAYDGYVLQCAIDQRCPLLTLDQGLSQAAQAAEVSLLEWPA